MTELEVSVAGVGRRRRWLRCGMAGRSYDRQETVRREYLCHVHALWSLVPPLSPQWLVQIEYLGRPALQVGLRDVEIGEREWPSLGSVYEVSLEGCIMPWDPADLEDKRSLPLAMPLPVALLGVTIFVIPSPHRGKQGSGGMGFP